MGRWGNNVCVIEPLLRLQSLISPVFESAYYAEKRAAASSVYNVGVGAASEGGGRMECGMPGKERERERKTEIAAPSIAKAGCFFLRDGLKNNLLPFRKITPKTHKSN